MLINQKYSIFTGLVLVDNTIKFVRVYKKLSEEDKIIIKYLRQKFGYGAKKIIKDHPEKKLGSL